MPALKIFVSSTTRDLTDCRREVCNLIRALGFTDIAMESWAANHQPPLASVRQKLAESDIYVAILAWLYGTPVPGEPKSYTEFEYDLAGSLSKPRLVFLKDRLCPVLPDDIDVNSTAIREFRSRVERELLVGHFQTELDLLRAVSAALFEKVMALTRVQALPSSEKVILALRQLTQGDLLARAQQMEHGSDDPARQWFIGLLARCNVGRFYVRRESLLASVSTWLMRTRTPYLFITGPSGIGKSNFILELIECIGRTPSPLAQRAVFVFPLGEYNPTQSFAANLTAHLARHGQLSPALTSEGLEECIRNGDALLILDGLDEFARNYSVEQCARVFAALDDRLDSNHSRVIVTCRDHVARRLQGSGAFLHARRGETVRVPKLSEAEARTALEARVGKRSAAYVAITTNPSLLRIAQTPLLLEMMSCIEPESWKKLSQATTEGGLYDVWFESIIATSADHPSEDVLAASTRTIDKVAEQMVRLRADLVSAADLSELDIAPEHLETLVRQPVGIFIKETSNEWGFVHGSFREFSLAKRAARELATGEFDLLARITKFDYVGAEPQMFLRGLFRDEHELLQALERAARAAMRDYAKWDGVLWNVFETVGNVGTAAAEPFIDIGVDILCQAREASTHGRPTYRTLYNIVRCLERLHTSAPRPYCDWVIEKQWPQSAGRDHFGAYAVRGYHMEHPRLGYFPPMFYLDGGTNSRQAKVSDCLLRMLEHVRSGATGEGATYLEVNCTFALIRWLDRDHVARARALLQEVSPPSRGNLFQAFLRLKTPSLFEGCSPLFKGMTVAFCDIRPAMVSADFVFRGVVFKEHRRSKIDGLRCDDECTYQ
jgi:hypothetical protein